MSGITDAGALADSWRRVAAGDRRDGDEFTANRVEACADALDELSERLRGEAQTGQQAVAWYVAYEGGESTLPVTFRTPEQAQQHADKFEGGTASVEPLYTRPQPAAPAAPDDGKVVVREASLRLAIRELNHARKGIGSAGRANYVHRLLLAMLGEEPIHETAEPAAPAPVAGGAVSRLPDELMDASDTEDGDGNLGASIAYADAAGRLRTALAQDRASQAGASRVPDGWRLVPDAPTDRMIDAMANNGVKHREWVSDVYAAMLAAAPSPDAEGEVGRE